MSDLVSSILGDAGEHIEKWEDQCSRVGHMS